MPDTLFWHFDKSSVYSVRSGYKVGKRLDCRVSSSSSTALGTWWNFLWGLKLPNKIIIFIWKACLNWLPTHLNLAKRGMKIDSGCPICRKKLESTGHALWSCTKLKQVCSSSASFLQHLKWAEHIQPVDFLLSCSNILTQSEMKVLCVFLWRIWWRRNLLVHQASSRCDENVVRWALNFVNELREACSLNVTHSISSVQLQQQVVQWCSPVVGIYKVNTDAAIQSAHNRVGIGIMIRDNMGNVMGCSTQVLEACFSPQVAEATAILRGISFAIDSGLLLTVFESDAKVVVDLINSGTAPRDETGTVIADILRLIHSHHFQVSFAPRSANMIAHSLAKLSFSFEDRFYLETYPPCLERLVTADCPV
ncbi:hypothetical protein Dsin_002202 [Dipteronia sinensis]|uniref:Uncharacterized protein n=1 Tax=Dipteronia sinensis TaxID=43782 RepID=A0AAE0B5C2_9ROSI|nr:hypothetical protein Dsin_002202 [Dipteronia sinensis]